MLKYALSYEGNFAVTDKIEFLAQLPIFKTLTDEELEALARIAHEYAFTDNAVIAYQRDVADFLTIVRSGRLFAREVDAQGVVRGTRSYLPGDYFGETWLFEEDVHPATIIGKGDGRLLIIRSHDFLEYLDEHLEVLENLEPIYDENDNIVSGLSEAGWAEAEKLLAKTERHSAAVSLQAEELVEYQSRRSRYNLLLRLLPPGILLFLAIIGTAVFVPQLPTTFMGFLSTLAVPGLIILALLLWLGFNYLDWRNDYFLITNMHLVHREFDLRTFRTSVTKVAIDKVQSVEVIKPSLIANLFNIGTVRITTAAQTGVIYFDNIDDPALVRDTLNRLGERVKALNAGREQSAMRTSLEEHFRAERPLQEIPAAEEEEEDTPPPRRLSAWAAYWRNYRWRVEDGKTITYHKHYFVLLKLVAWPAALLLFLIILTWIITRNMQIPFSQYWFLAIIFYALNLGWLIWQIEDWRNDTFQLTDKMVIDIDRRPFGFGESRKQAALSNIQNVRASRPGLLPTIFNYGDVSIETAGVDSDITFEDVPNPGRIQSDIFKRLEEFRQQQRVKEGAQRRKEYAVLLDVYKQAMEQGRIPQRTPPPPSIEL